MLRFQQLYNLELNKKTDSEEMWATPYYVPPEKLYGEIEDFRSDIYSLGATLFHALSGVPPCSSDTSSIEELKVLKQKKISLEVSAPNISIATCELVDRMMEKSPENRHGSYEDLLDDFNKAKNSLSQSSVKLVGAGLRIEKNEKSNAHFKMGLLLISYIVPDIVNACNHWDKNKTIIILHFYEVSQIFSS